MTTDLFEHEPLPAADKILEHMPDVSAAKWEGTLSEMLFIVEDRINKERPGTAGNGELARRVVFSLCDVMGGSIFYLPRGDALKRAIRDAEIFREWRAGSKEDTLARKYNLALQSVYGILKKQRQLNREPDLFADEN